MNENLTESSHAQCDWCSKLKTVRMIEQDANNKGSHRLLLEMLSFRVCLSRLRWLSHFIKTTSDN